MASNRGGRRPAGRGGRVAGARKRPPTGSPASQRRKSSDVPAPDDAVSEETETHEPAPDSEPDSEDKLSDGDISDTEISAAVKAADEDEPSAAEDEGDDQDDGVVDGKAEVDDLEDDDDDLDDADDDDPDDEDEAEAAAPVASPVSGRRARAAAEREAATAKTSPPNKKAATKSDTKPAKKSAASGPKKAASKPAAGAAGRRGLMRFLREVIAELGKVVWPGRRELIVYTSVVIVFMAFMVALVAGLDILFAQGVLAVFG